MYAQNFDFFKEFDQVKVNNCPNSRFFEGIYLGFTVFMTRIVILNECGSERCDAELWLLFSVRCVTVLYCDYGIVLFYVFLVFISFKKEP